MPTRWWRRSFAYKMATNDYRVLPTSYKSAKQLVIGHAKNKNNLN